MRQQLEGSQAVARTVARCRPEVVCAYPISPQTHIVEHLAGRAPFTRQRMRHPVDRRVRLRHHLLHRAAVEFLRPPHHLFSNRHVPQCTARGPG